MIPYGWIAASTVVVAAWAHGWTTGAGYEQHKAHALAQAALQEQSAQFERAIAARDGVDRQYQETLTHVQAEHDRLTAGIARGDFRVHVRARCPLSPPGPAGSPDADRAELDPADGQRAADLRAGIQRLELKLTALQRYVSTVCLNTQA